MGRPSPFDPGQGRVRALRDNLFDTYGPQGWWPGESRLEIMVGAVLVQNTAWINAERAIGRLKDAGVLDIDSLLTLTRGELADLLRPAGYYNLKAGRLTQLLRTVAEAGGERALDDFPTVTLRRLLLGARGTGPETADDILLYAFERPVFVIDAYTRRLLARLGWASGNEGYEVLRAGMERGCVNDVNMMQELHALIVCHAKEACRKHPSCEACACAAALCPGFRPDLW